MFKKTRTVLGSTGASPHVDGDHKAAKSQKNPYSIDEILRSDTKANPDTKNEDNEDDVFDESREQTQVDNGSDLDNNENGEDDD
jgi:hypothetical protein